MAAGYIKFNIEFIPYQVNDQFTPGNKCNAVTFLNTGTSAVTIDNMIVLQQGQSFAIEGNLGETMAQHTFTISFATGASNSLVVIRKTYVD